MRMLWVSSTLFLFLLPLCTAQTCSDDLYQTCMDQYNQGTINMLVADNGAGKMHALIKAKAKNFSDKYPSMRVNVVECWVWEFVQEMENDIETGLNSYSAYYSNVGQLVGTFANDFADLSSKVHSRTAKVNTNWTEIGYFFRTYNAIHDGKLLTMPMDGDMHALYYIGDVFEKYGKTPPTTLEEYAELAQFFQGKDLDGDGIGDYGSCFGTGDNNAPYHFLSMLLPYLQYKGTSQGGFFDLETMEPFFDTDAGREVMRLWQLSAWPHGGASHPFARKYAGPNSTLDLFFKGKCAMAITWANTFWTDESALVHGRVMTALSPGTTRVWDRNQKKLVTCTREICPYAKEMPDGQLINYAPYNAYNGYGTAVNSHVSIAKQNIAYNFLTYLMTDEVWVQGITIGWQPVKLKFYDIKFLQGTMNYSGKASKLHSEVNTEMLDHPNVVLELRFNRANDYFTSLATVLNQSWDKLGPFTNLNLEDGAELAARMVQDQWNKITDETGRNVQRISYKKMLSVYNPWLDCNRGQTYDESSDACIGCPAGKKSSFTRQHCIECEPGTFAGENGQTACELCKRGMYTNSTGGLACLQCPPGTYSQAGSANCTPCVPGTYTSSTGSVDCTFCFAGRFQEAEGQTDCTQCPETMTTSSEGRVYITECVCKVGYYGSSATSLESSCTSCPPLKQSSLGSMNSSECALSAAGGAVIAAAILVLTGSICVFFVVRGLRNRYNTHLDALLEQKLVDGLRCVKTLDFPMALTSASSFLQLDLGTVRTLHEGCRNLGMLIFLDTLTMVHHFKTLERRILFLSYQWASWDESGPDQIQWRCMQRAIDQVVGMNSTSVEGLYVWLDVLCIPQFNDSIKALAVGSLYTYAQQADIMLVIAPTTTHNNLKIQCNVDTYKRRVWCRVEQFAFFCFHGVTSLFVTVAPGVVDPCPACWMHDVGCIFDGDMTCCAKKHATANFCDKESLIKPLLALYFDLYTRMKSERLDETAKLAWNFIANQIDKIFPAKFDYITKTNQNIDNVAKRILFGDMITRVTRYVDNDLDRAYEMLSQTGSENRYMVSAHDNRSAQLKTFTLKSARSTIINEETIDAQPYDDYSIVMSL